MENVVNHVAVVQIGAEVNSGMGTMGHQPVVHQQELYYDRVWITKQNTPDFWNAPDISTGFLLEHYATTLSLPVGARLRNYWERWLNLGAHPSVVSKLRFGIPLDWAKLPPRV